MKILMRWLIRSRLIWISTVCKCVSEFIWCPKFHDYPRVKSGKFGRSAKFGQPLSLYYSSIFIIKDKLTKQTVKILMRRLIWISTVCKCVSEFTWCPNLPDFTLIDSNKSEALPNVMFGEYDLFATRLTYRVKSGKFGHQVNSDTHLQTL